MRLVEIMDTIHRGLNRGAWCYLASFDIAGALDNAPQRQLMQALFRMGVDLHSRGTIRHWLGQRTFQVKLTAHDRSCYGKPYSVTKGLPQGGVLSPVLWPAFFNQIIA